MRCISVFFIYIDFWQYGKIRANGSSQTPCNSEIKKPAYPFTVSIINAKYAKKGISQLSIIVRPTILEIYKTNF